MNRRSLGSTGLMVSTVCFGTLSISPLQANLRIQQGADVIRAALDHGINFIDTAELYQAYPYIRYALIGVGPGRVAVFSKTYAFDAATARKSVHDALRGTGQDVLGGFLLHEQESEFTLRGHREALEELIRLKEQGLIQAVGISTHRISGVRAAVTWPEIDVIHPLYNRSGLGIADGTPEMMLTAVAAAHAAGKGLYGMKVLGGGHLTAQADLEIRHALELPWFSSVALGMKTIDEVHFNCAAAEGRPIPTALRERIGSRPRRLMVEHWCSGCTRCVERCPSRALRLSETERRIEVDHSLCVLCGYCAAACPEFCLKVV